MNFEIAVVNYNTPDLIDKLFSTRDEYGYKHIHVRLVDGSDIIQKQNELDNVIKNYDNFTLHRMGYNIHHGTGLHYALGQSTCDYVLCLDSDSYFTAKGGIEYLFSLVDDNTDYVGNVCYVNKHGVAISGQYSEAYPFKYPHPSILLVDRKKYFESGLKFIKHGAPVIQVAIGYKGKENRIAHADKIYDYFQTLRRGTVNRYGYSL